MFFTNLVNKNPMRKMVIVPKTIVRFVWNGLLKAMLFPSLKTRGDKLIHIINITPVTTPITASVFPALLEI